MNAYTVLGLLLVAFSLVVAFAVDAAHQRRPSTWALSLGYLMGGVAMAGMLLIIFTWQHTYN